MNLIKYIDNIIIYNIQKMRNNFFDIFFEFITNLGDNGFIWITAAIFFVLRGQDLTGQGIIVALAFSTAFCLLIVKKVAKRGRPCDNDKLTPLTIARPSGNSFPSAHSSAAFAAAGVIGATAPQFTTVAMTMASLISFSRVYLFVHYPSDVVAGILVGTAFSSLAVRAVLSLLS